jgi:hypothetical protein
MFDAFELAPPLHRISGMADASGSWMGDGAVQMPLAVVAAEMDFSMDRAAPFGRLALSGGVLSSQIEPAAWTIKIEKSPACRSYVGAELTTSRYRRGSSCRSIAPKLADEVWVPQ